MGSHYIPVKTLKVDDIMKTLCPAAGYYDPEDTDALAVHCPANGYEPIFTDPDIPIEVDPGTVAEDNIVFIHDVTKRSVLDKFSIYTSSSAEKKIEIYDNSDVLLDTITTNTSTTLYLSVDLSSYGKDLVKVVISINTAGANFSRISSTATTTKSGYGTISLIYNCPYITSMSSMCIGHRDLREVQILGATDLVTKADSAFNASGILHFTFKGNWDVVTSFQSMFRGSDVEIISFDASFNAPQLWDFYFFAFQAFSLKVLHLPVIHGAARLASMCKEARSLREFSLAGAPGCTTIDNILRDCIQLQGDIVFPDMPSLTAVGYMVYGCVKVNSVSMPINMTATISQAVTGCAQLRRFELPRTYNSPGSAGSSTWGNTPACKEIRLPDVLTNADTGYVKDMLNCTSAYNVEKIWGDMDGVADETDCWLSGTYYDNLKEFNCPKLTVGQLRLSGLASLEKVEVDWVNSPWTGSYGVALNSCNLDTAEIERIFTALPNISTGKSINVTNNPGYAAADKSIATAKGWAVN